LFKKKPKEEPLKLSCVEYDIEKVRELYQRALSRVIEHSSSEALESLKQLFIIRRNFEVLQLEKCFSPSLIDSQRGRITAVTGLMHDLLTYREKTSESSTKDIKDNITMIKKRRRSGGERGVSI